MDPSPEWRWQLLSPEPLPGRLPLQLVQQPLVRYFPMHHKHIVDNALPIPLISHLHSALWSVAAFEQ